MRRAARAVAVLAAATALSTVLIGVSRGQGGRVRPSPASWRAYETNVNPGSGVQFVSPTTGFALSGQPVNSLDDLLAAPRGLTLTWPSSRLLVSHDAGRNWRTTLATSGGFWSLAFADRLHGLAVGVTKLFRTADGGRRWQRIPEPGRPLVRDGYGVDPETVLGLTTSGRLVVSRTRGSAWTSTAYKGRAQAICTLGDEVVLADPGAGVWRSKDPSYPFERVARGTAADPVRALVGRPVVRWRERRRVHAVPV